ncbi:hypothetical protein ACFVRD_48570 [Streptomyces sp. NPDC057908]|uniref:hypothetical protein n=1 Tax=Streptomyces sp. NPDC057908 TaxID=3346276 RepID=UPI0036ED89F7
MRDRSDACERFCREAENAQDGLRASAIHSPIAMSERAPVSTAAAAAQSSARAG